MNKRISLPVLALVLALAGCTFIPKYKRPAAAIAPAWPVAGKTNLVAAAAAVPAENIGWRDFFRDARLRRLIELALTNNPDLRVAMLNVERARAQYRIQRAPLLPTINAVGSGLRTRQPVLGSYPRGGAATTYSQYSVSLGTTAYELDLFGRIRSLKTQALEDFFATEQARKSAQIALVAQVGGAYLAQREVEQQLAVARKTLKTVEDSYRLTKRSYEAGVDSELDLRTAQAQVQTARLAVSVYQQQLAEAENSLVLVIGTPLPVDLPPEPAFNPDVCLSELQPGLPSDLLQRRPDILAAEHRLKAANASIGAARAAFFPTITLTASGGSSSAALEDLFAPGSQAWTFSPQIKLPIFTGGANLANLDVAKVDREIQVADYQKAIQTAFREVADALAVRANVRDQLAAGRALVRAEQRRYQLAEARFQEGVVSYLNVLSSQQDLYNAQQGLIQTEYSRLFNLINLYQALGGGWREHTRQLAAEQ